jgi:hypothetical protein
MWRKLGKQFIFNRPTWTANLKGKIWTGNRMLIKKDKHMVPASVGEESYSMSAGTEYLMKKLDCKARTP